MRRRLVVACLLAFLSSALTAAPAIAEAPATAKTPATKPARHPHYLTPDSIDVVALLPDPPAADSAEHQAEFDVLLKLQQDRDGMPVDVARAKDEESHLTVFAFADAVGPGFTKENCPKTAAFFKSALSADLSYFNDVAKAHWNRPRPYTDPRIHSLFKEHDGSYPSGHSIRATLFGEVLAAALPPEYREKVIARSQQMGWDREILGVHFPTDIYAGRILGHALAHALLANPDVHAQVEALKPELERALAAHEK